mmetsp:Transcript_5331/g.8188  ORF Transcript_5331/g.8188 Transcript_5331/m.8188 type:complete len:114 (+) Transcript_5331:246-587(+)
MVTLNSMIFSSLTLTLAPSSISGQSLYLGKGFQPGDEWNLRDDEYGHPTRGACIEQSNGESTCECVNGWEGDGRRDECIEDDSCPDNSVCVNTNPLSDPYPQYKCDWKLDMQH